MYPHKKLIVSVSKIYCCADLSAHTGTLIPGIWTYNLCRQRWPDLFLFCLWGHPSLFWFQGSHIWTHLRLGGSCQTYLRDKEASTFVGGSQANLLRQVNKLLDLLIFFILAHRLQLYTICVVFYPISLVIMF